MHVLLSGASGFLGSACVDLLRRFPDIELSVVRASRVECILPLGSRELFVEDPSDFSSLEKMVGSRRPTHVLHIGAVSSPAACEQKPDLATRGNFEFTKAITHLAARANAHLVVTSSDLVFDGAKAPADGFSEADSPNPISVYSRSKRDAELVALEYDRACVVRLSLLYGHSLSKSRGVLGWIEDALHAQEELLLFSDEFRTPIHVADAARSLFQLATLGETGLWHCGGPTRMSRLDFGLSVAAALGYDPSTIRSVLRQEVRSTPPRPPDVSLNSSKLRARLSEMPRALAEALAQE